MGSEQRGSSRTARLTKRVVEGASLEAERYTIWDSDLRGFGVRVSPTGRKTYIARYRVGGGRSGTLRQHVVGQHGHLTPDEARALAKKVLGGAATGLDPQGERAAKRAEMTVSELCDLYLEEGVTTKKASTLYIDRLRIARHIKPMLGSRRISTVTRADIEKFLRDVAEGKIPDTDSAWVRGGKGAASRSTGLLGAIFRFAAERKLIKESPVVGVRRYPDRKRERFLSPAELGRLGEALAIEEAAGGVTPARIVRLLLLTGARKNEIAQLKWSEVDFDHGVLRLEDSKTGQAIIPLGAAALEVLSQIERADDTYAFPQPKEPGEPYRALDWAWVRIRSRAGLDDVRIHDLRHSFASVGLGSGQGLAIIGKLLNHSHVATTSRYAHLADDPVRSAADRISATIAGAMRGMGDKGEPTPMRRDRGQG